MQRLSDNLTKSAIVLIQLMKDVPVSHMIARYKCVKRSDHPCNDNAAAAAEKIVNASVWGRAAATDVECITLSRPDMTTPLSKEGRRGREVSFIWGGVHI